MRIHTRHCFTQWALSTVLLTGVIGLSSCPGHPSPGKGEGSTASAGELQGPGIKFTRKGLGLPTEALDYAGTAASALAGAKSVGDVFFGASAEGTVQLYRRDLRRNVRTFVTELPRFQDGSLATTPDGKKLVYCRLRPLKDVIDDPAVIYPTNLAVPYIYDVQKKEEHRLFDFNTPELRRWRANGMSPFISPDGKRAFALTYDTDQLLLQRGTEEWLKTDTALHKPGAKIKPDDLKKGQDLLGQFLTTPIVHDKLAQAGVSVDAKQPVNDAVRAAIRKIHDTAGPPQVALLMWNEGQSRVLPLQPEDKYAQYFHFIAAAGNKQLIIGAQPMEGSPYDTKPLYTCDLQSGALRPLGEIKGLTKLLTLDPAEQELRVCYSPVTGSDRKILPETHLLRLRLDGGASVETPLGGDYLGIVDLDESGNVMAGQDINDYNLYLVDTRTAQRTLISEQRMALTGLFLLGDASALVYLDDGVTYRIGLTGDLRNRKDRITDADFTPYKTQFDAFLTKLGFTPPGAGWDYHWEERDGLGAHTVAVEMSAPGTPGQAALLRYDVDRKTVTTCWLPDPAQYPFPAAKELQGKDFDFYDAKALAELVLDRAGWLPAEHRTLYQPGPNPLYDRKSDSYVITFRDSYELDNPKQQVFSNEATVRVTAKTGKVAELTFVPVDEVHDQPIKVDRKRLAFLVKNEPDQPFPDSAPIKVDVDKARLIVYGKRIQGITDGVFNATVRYRLCWEVDTLLEPQGDLIFTNVIDTESGERLGYLSYIPVAPTATTVER